MGGLARPDPLPSLMVAPNGARRGHDDHPAIPLTDDALVETARACAAEGADGLHVHIRDAAGRHLLDAGRYRALLARLSEAVPGLYLQVTSEAGGRYLGEAQREMVRALAPRHVSVALREMIRVRADRAEAAAFYAWAAESGVQIQHILYDGNDVVRFVAACREGTVPGDHHLVQLVLGSYGDDRSIEPWRVAYLLAPLRAARLSVDWMLCAFGPGETACLAEAARRGGKVRVGFENSLWNADGRIARDNAERVREVRAAIAALR